MERHVWVTHTPYLDAYLVQGDGRLLFAIAWRDGAWRQLRSVPTLNGWPLIKASERCWSTRYQAVMELLRERRYDVGQLLEDGIKWLVVPVGETPTMPAPRAEATVRGPVEDTPSAPPSGAGVRSTSAAVSSSSPLILKKRRAS